MYAHMKDPVIIPNTSKPDTKTLLYTDPQLDLSVFTNQSVINKLWNHPVFGGSILYPLKGAVTGKGSPKEQSNDFKIISKPNKLEKFIDKMRNRSRLYEMKQLRLRDSADGLERFADMWILSEDEITEQSIWYEEMMDSLTGVVRIAEYEVEPQESV